jgi:uncharacterized protein YecE (DUF72 family)
MRNPILRVGTAGWSVPSIYADQVPTGGAHLERYARRLNAVEINSSFYRPHRRATYERWAASVPVDFRFSVKVPKTVTHNQRLAACDTLVDRFLEETAGLGRKLGALLVQLPPSLKYEAGVVATFFRDFRGRTETDIVCEPRHATWFTGEADELLAMFRVARVAADPALVPAAAVPGGWRGLVYYRLHGSPRMYFSNYDAPILATLADKLKHHGAASGRGWCIFDNTAASCALGNALTVSGHVGQLERM